MSWSDAALATLSAKPVCGYRPDDSPATEPTALAALALAGHGKLQPAHDAAENLRALQSAEGFLGVRRDEHTPRWPTSLAIMAWLAIDGKHFQKQLTLAVDWALSISGERMETDHAGHNGQLAAWPWVEGTHSWQEPSALFAIALKGAGLNENARTREAVELLLDRILPGGGCNYGNTVVLGQLLRPHLQPSGVTMVALADELDSQRKIANTLDYLEMSISSKTPSSSLAWSLLGLAAHGRPHRNSDQLLAGAYEQTMSRDRSPYKLALLLLAALADKSPLLHLQRGGGLSVGT